MKKKKEIPWTNIGLIIGLGFAWTKLGLGAAVKEIEPVRRVFATVEPEYPPLSVVGHMGQAEWQTRYGGSQLDYEDWLRGQ